ncbi:MAG: M23 family metallopeptidase [Chloroflexota bacterium]|nr:M23 family metallopeptidase [Chloroflexota bacterium]
MNQPLETGLYEPEGIYLSTPFDGTHEVIQFFGQHPDHYAQYRYNSIALKGHPGIDFAMPAGTNLFAVDNGRIMAISYEAGGFERYIKIEHRWGESFYAHVGDVQVEAGQLVKRNDAIAASGPNRLGVESHLHFAIRVTPYNRFDGWGGFIDPLSFLNPSNIVLPDSEDEMFHPIIVHRMADETPGMRRP